MAKWYGKIGFFVTEETKPGVYVEKITTRNYYGEVTRNSRGLQTTNQVNDNITVSATISILLDPYAENNFHSIKYVEFMGAKWKVSNAEVQLPRLLLTLGGVYNGE